MCPTPPKPEPPTAHRQVAVVTDSATALPESISAQAGLAVTRMEVTIGDRTYTDGPEGDLRDFYELLRHARRLPTTSAPRPQAWLETFRDASKVAESIFCITISAQLSAAYDSALVAADLASDELPGVEIQVFDSRAAAGSQALIALEAARAAAIGADLRSVGQAATTVANRVRLVAYLDTLEYIWRGGRVPKLAVWATNLLDIKPLMEFSAGKVGVIARPRSRRRAFDRLLAEARRDLSGRRAHVNVMHADAEREADELRRRMEDEFNCVEIFVTQFHPFMGAHTGPGLLAAAYWAE